MCDRCEADPYEDAEYWRDRADTAEYDLDDLRKSVELTEDDLSATEEQRDAARLIAEMFARQLGVGVVWPGTPLWDVWKRDYDERVAAEAES